MWKFVVNIKDNARFERVVGNTTADVCSEVKITLSNSKTEAINVLDFFTTGDV